MERQSFYTQSALQKDARFEANRDRKQRGIAGRVRSVNWELRIGRETTLMITYFVGFEFFETNVVL